MPAGLYDIEPNKTALLSYDTRVFLDVMALCRPGQPVYAGAIGMRSRSVKTFRATATALSALGKPQ